MKVLVSAASRHGATSEIAKAIADALTTEGIEAEVRRPEEVASLASYDGIVLGSGVYAGRWLGPVKQLIERESAALATKPVWLFSSGPLGDPLKPQAGPRGRRAPAEADGCRRPPRLRRQDRQAPARDRREGDLRGRARARRRLPALAGDHRMGGGHRRCDAGQGRPGRTRMTRERRAGRAGKPEGVTP